MGADALRCAFLECLPEDGRAAWSTLPEAELEQALRALCSKVRWVHHGVEVAAPAFVSFIAARWPPAEEPDVGFSCLRAVDLFLTCACQAGETEALRIVQGICKEQVLHASARLRLSGMQVEALMDDVRRRVLTPSESGALKLSEYRGTGALKDWVKKAAMRAGLNLKAKKEQSEREGDDRLLDALFRGDDPEMMMLKAEIRQELRTAFREALQRLERGQRNLLRLCLIDRLTLQQVASLSGFSTPTASRRLASARDALSTDMQRALKERLRVEIAELPGLIDLASSQLDLSLSAILRESRPEP